VLPATPPRDMTVRAVDDPSIEVNPTDVTAGYALYAACSTCHGQDLVSTGGFAPDLRESRLAIDPETLWSIVHEGSLIQGGMPRFEMLTREQVMQIYAYIRAGARAAAHPASRTGADRQE
jgi:quinohemoprotein ethanol dehydrogenase